ncbi:lysozyme C, milk isozyme-like [Uloborus diversus]|uniref:lysozyme C, milk isozyme-like n=1 Tax=Uloborus diversus TaxID=327109 RepID=UPI002409331A|nr:lysozyme C, milk isozyme-like [Uloborus diversus]
MQPWRCSSLSLLLELVTILLLVLSIDAKIYDRCELGRELYEKYHIPLADISKWLCIIHWESAYDTHAMNNGRKESSIDYGMFQINNDKWCKSSLRPSQNRCQTSCENFLDDDISDDVRCIQLILREKGFNEWMSYGLRCRSNTDEYFKNCDLTSRALNVGMKVKLEPQPAVRFNVKHVPDYPYFAKVRVGLLTQPKGFKLNTDIKETKLNFFTKHLGAYYRMKPFFSLKQYVTR